MGKGAGTAEQKILLEGRDYLYKDQMAGANLALFRSMN